MANICHKCRRSATCDSMRIDVEACTVFLPSYDVIQAENKQQAEFLSLAKEQMDADQAEIKRLREEIEQLKGTRKCSCGESIFFYTYCPRCRKNWES